MYAGGFITFFHFDLNDFSYLRASQASDIAGKLCTLHKSAQNGVSLRNLKDNWGSFRAISPRTHAIVAVRSIIGHL